MSIRLLIGRRKRGKTTLGVYMVRKSPARAIFDPRGMIRASDGPPQPGQSQPYRARTAEQLQVGFDMLAEGSLQEVVYTPREDALGRPFQAFCGELKRWVDDPDTASKPLGVLIDELGWIETAHRDNATLRRVLRSCEPEIFHVFLTCHRPVDVPVNTRSIADYWEIFQCTQEHDLEVIRDRCNERTAQLVQRLQGRSFVSWDDAESEISEYPDRPDASGKSAWYVELRTVGERATGPNVLHGIEKKPLDAKLFS